MCQAAFLSDRDEDILDDEEDGKTHKEDHANRSQDVLDLVGAFLPGDGLAEGDKDIPAIQGRKGNEIEAAEVEGDIGPEAEEVGSRARLDGLGGYPVDGDDAADVLPAIRREELS